MKPKRTREEARRDRDEKRAALAELVARGSADPGITRIAFERFGAGFSVKNQIAIIMQRPGATKVAGFRAWRELGRQVCKGAKGIAIMVPLGPPMLAEDTDGKTKVRQRFGTGYVFDIADTEPVAVEVTA